jgi:hypothetical protein
VLSTIRPTRNVVNRSFPVLGFTVHTGESPSWFEIAIATDPALFEPDAKANRTSSNFYSTHGEGPLPAERGDAVYLVPPSVLANFAGSDNLYYALATFTRPDRQNPSITKLPPGASTPVQISRSFTGESRRLPAGGSRREYRATYPSANGEAPVWAGDVAAPGTTEKASGNGQAAPGGAPTASAPAPTTPPAAHASALAEYRDGFEETHGPVATEDDGAYGVDGPIPDDTGGVAAAAVAEALAVTPEYPGASRFVPAHPTNYRARSSPRTIERIVIHITDGGANINGTVSWFASQHQPPAGPSSAHYVVGQDGEVVQMVRNNDVAWHAHTANGNSIGIEHVANSRGLRPTQDEYDASARLVCWLCRQYGIPADRDHIVGHNEADPTTTHRGCPTVAWDWDVYMATVAAACASSNGEAAAPAAESLGAPYDIHWDDVDLVAQPDGMSCWAAAAAMVVGWRDRVCIDPNEVVRGSGPYVDIGPRGGLSPNSRDELAAAWGLAIEPPMDYSIDGFAQLLQSVGPLYVGVAVPSGHAVTVIGLTGDGTPDGTLVHYHDPWPPGTGAANQTKTYSRFMLEYDNRMTVDPSGNVNVQILHANGRRPIAESRALAAESFDVNWDDVELVHQPTEMSCWAAAASMVVGWRDRISIDPTEVAHHAGHWERYTEGLLAEDFPTLARGMNLEPEPAQSYTIDAFRNLLETKGPLWVAADVPGFHAIVVTGIYGDGSSSGEDTFVRINDPWDRDPGTPGNPGAYRDTHDSGSRYVLTWRQFVSEYENVQRHGDDWGDVRVQIMHAAGTDGRQPSRGTGAAAQALGRTIVSARSPIPRTTLERISDSSHDVEWTLENLSGLKFPHNSPRHAGTGDFSQARDTVEGQHARIGDQEVWADFDIEWEYNGRSLGNLSMQNVRAHGTNLITSRPSLSFTAHIQDVAQVYRSQVNPGAPTCAAIRINVEWRFSSNGNDAVAMTYVTVYGDGSADQHWTQP